jgi:hypothetical protein
LAQVGLSPTRVMLTAYVGIVRHNTKQLMSATRHPTSHIGHICGGATLKLNSKGQGEGIIEAISIPTESIVNLLYLIKHNRHDTAKILNYARTAEEQIQCIVDVIETFKR